MGHKQESGVLGALGHLVRFLLDDGGNADAVLSQNAANLCKHPRLI